MSELIRGTPASPGQAVGPLVWMPSAPSTPPLDSALNESTDSAIKQILTSAATVGDSLQKAAEAASGTAKSLLEATAMMAADPSLIAQARKLVEEGASPTRAVWDAAADVAAKFESLGGYMAERVRDIQDVRDRLIATLQGDPMPGVPQRDEPFILAAHDLSPADTATLAPGCVLGIIMTEGGPTSHAAIVSRTLGIAAVVGAKTARDIAENTTVVVDGTAGTVIAEPSDDQVVQARRSSPRRHAFSGHGHTADGHAVELLANIGNPADAAQAAAAKAEGVGLFRTEFCYLNRTQAPSVAEQVDLYSKVIEAFPNKKVIFRTLDSGADKPLPFLSPSPEPNPALGVRGYRTHERHSGILANQLTAIATAARAGTADVWVMAPMIATAEQAQRFVEICHKHGVEQAGVMIEIPAAALLSSRILQHAAFASIGTNDLTQYVMAADRQLSDLAQLATPWQPAVLQLVETTCQGGESSGRPVSVCGEAAADPALAVVLVGLGVRSLSMTAAAIPEVAATLERVSLAQCHQLAQLALGATDARAARETVQAYLPHPVNSER